MWYKKPSHSRCGQDKKEETRVRQIDSHSDGQKKKLLRYRESNPGLLGSNLRASDVSHYTIPDILMISDFLFSTVIVQNKIDIT